MHVTLVVTVTDGAVAARSPVAADIEEDPPAGYRTLDAIEGSPPFEGRRESAPHSEVATRGALDAP